MTFISYAQNFEDVMLWRALKHVENGFYIDVGANDPVIDSVTKAFYDRGWHGINIEPLSAHYKDLVSSRPRDITLQVAAGAESGEIELWECDVRGWATASVDVVAQHKADGHEGTYHKVPVMQLKAICAEHAADEIHFMKIDVEGLEKYVIEGMDFSQYRPWILVIEATHPNSTQEVHYEWEAQVIDAGYKLAYLDGLNRFYVANEHAELMAALRYPPNVFDHYEQSRLYMAESRALQAEERAAQAEERLSGLLNSNSWRVTAPMRWVSSLFKGEYKLGKRMQGSIMKRMLRSALLNLRKFIVQNRMLKELIKRVLHALPVVDKFIMRFLSRETHASFVYEARRFEELRSVQLMQRIDEIPANSPSIIFLGASNDGK